MTSLIMNKKFDTVSLTSSSAYFAILAVYLIYILTGSISSKQEKDIFNGLRIATLILPIIYFAKLGYLGLKVKNSNTVQKTLLSIYFLLVLILLILDIIEGDKKQYIYALVYVSPLLIVSSFYLCYEQWKNNLPKYITMLSFFLALLYYTSFYDFLIQSNDQDSNRSILIIQTIISFVLFLLFGYSAYSAYRSI
jgi:hypothetical protein